MFNMNDYIMQTGIVSGSGWIFFLSVLAAVVIAAVFLPKSKRNSYTGFLKGLYEFLHFEKYWIPTLVRFVYLFVCCSAVIGGLYCMFSVNFFIGLGTMVVTPVLARLVIEGLLVLYSIREDLAKVREMMEKKDQQ